MQCLQCEFENRQGVRFCEKCGAKLDDGRTVTAEMYKQFRDGGLEKLGGINARHYRDVVAILDQLVLSESFTEFLTWPAYKKLIQHNS